MFAYEGKLHIVLLEPESLTSPATYAVTFARYASSGGALKRMICYKEEDLAQFLTEIGIPPKSIEKALKELKDSGSATIEHVTLNEAQLQNYGLGEASIAESIRLYLRALTS